MKILLVQNMLYVPTFGGANKSNRILLEELAKRKHVCRVIAPAIGCQGGPQTHAQFLEALASRGIHITAAHAGVDVFHHNGVEVHAVTHTQKLSDFLVSQSREFQPTWVLVCNDVGYVLLEAALEACPARVVYLARTTWELPFGPATVCASPTATARFQQAAGIATVSHYLKDYIRQWGNLNATVLPISLFGSGPFPNFGRFDTGFVTMVNPCALKGVSIFLELARQLPDVPFAAVPTWGTTHTDRLALEQLPNVHILNPVDDVEQIFAQTSILLVPSLWAEAKARIVIEAMLHGLPVLASEVGGIPEAKLGLDYLLPVRPIERYQERFDDRRNPIPVIPEQDIGPWLGALTELLANREHYNRLSMTSQEAALRFISTWTMDAVEDFLLNLAPRAEYSDVSAHTEAQDAVNRELLAQLSPDKRALLALRLRKKRSGLR